MLARSTTCYTFIACCTNGPRERSFGQNILLLWTALAPPVTGPLAFRKRIAGVRGGRYIVAMTTVKEIEHAIEQLPSDQFSQIRDWIVERDWEKWDEQIENDSEAGALDFLIDEASRDAKSGDTRPL
jgi:hypothetical protein